MRSIGSVASVERTSSSRMTTRPSGFSRSLAIFATNLHGATPAESGLRADLVLDAASDGGTVTEQGPTHGHVEERFVHAQAFDERRVSAEDLEDLLAHLAVALSARRYDDELRAQT